MVLDDRRVARLGNTGKIVTNQYKIHRAGSSLIGASKGPYSSGFSEGLAAILKAAINDRNPRHALARACDSINLEIDSADDYLTLTQDAGQLSWIIENSTDD